MTDRDPVADIDRVKVDMKRAYDAMKIVLHNCQVSGAAILQDRSHLKEFDELRLATFNQIEFPASHLRQAIDLLTDIQHRLRPPA